ncbi:hypothetical protein P691DRAFT_732228 [Macrolepiota fuliginosa MF-IS2]|uniref:Nephrocystin 3-like N-terminal domain-containing protein n=1 Tax=Macrolepiota fuliginosa MF-IS2 TaxID=1400762 RepID=A0A9P6C049_9AGAR|nr:hypothetical protein P691DRAFT_732228 [Macrolepiota fuliginosa MF-IS2]
MVLVVIANPVLPEVINILSQRSLPSVELNSLDRAPQPRCLEGTRTKLIEGIREWMDKGDHEILWLYGLVGVGKSALAQTLGEWATQTGILRAAIFLSESPHRNDLSRLFVSIAHQIARREPQYSIRVSEQLLADDRLLMMDLKTQFRKLIVEPLSGLRNSQGKLVVIIDRLDESKGEGEQCEVLRLIAGALTSPQSIPLRWMICSRPEPHLHRTFLKEFETRCKWTLVPMDGKDIDVFVRAEFRSIADTHSYAVNPQEVWPAEEDIGTIVHASSGLFVYASTIIIFIGDPDLATPKAQLAIALEFIRNPHAEFGPGHSTNPLKALDALYSHILSRIHSNHLSTALRVFGMCALCPPLPILELANLLGVSQEKFYAALLRVHSIVRVPLPEKAPAEHLHFFHSSFIEFLRVPSRSQRFFLDPQSIYSDFGEACFSALGQTKLLYAKNLFWKPSKPNPLSLAHRILTYAVNQVWSACVNIQDIGGHHLFDMIVDFNFTRLQFHDSKIPARQLRYFVWWLTAQMEKNNRESIIHWKEVKTPRFAARETGEKDRCFTIGQGSKAVMVQITSELVILSSVTDV